MKKLRKKEIMKKNYWYIKSEKRKGNRIRRDWKEKGGWEGEGEEKQKAGGRE